MIPQAPILRVNESIVSTSDGHLEIGEVCYQEKFWKNF